MPPVLSLLNRCCWLFVLLVWRLSHWLMIFVHDWLPKEVVCWLIVLLVCRLSQWLLSLVAERGGVLVLCVVSVSFVPVIVDHRARLLAERGGVFKASYWQLMLPAGIYRSIHCVREMLSLVSACVPPRPQLILSFSVHSGGSTVAIDNKIEQAMVSTVVPVVLFCFTCLFLLLCESLDGILFVRTESLKWKSPDIVSIVCVFVWLFSRRVLLSCPACLNSFLSGIIRYNTTSNTWACVLLLGPIQASGGTHRYNSSAETSQ